MSGRVVVVGAGMGGLAAAARLAAAGREVDLVEALDVPGGKAGRVTLDGLRCDTGPSVLTMPDVVDELFAACGKANPVVLRTLEPAFAYRWPDGTRVVVHHAPDATVASVRESLGSDAARELEAFLAYAGRIWEIAAPAFVYGPAPGPSTLLRMGPSRLFEMRHLDVRRSMGAAIRDIVREPHLRDLLLRYATYNGSDPRVAPATLNCIAWVEMVGGCFGVQGGMAALVDHLAELASSLGVRMHLGERVTGFEEQAGRIHAVRTAGHTFPCDAVVVNADVSHLADLLPSMKRPTLPPSTSGWTALVRAPRQDRAAHEALFPSRYDAEFEDLFDHERAPTEPTVYACAQDRAHGTGNWGASEPLFVMANAPAVSASSSDEGLRDRVLARLEVMAPGAEVLWERHPRDLAATFPGTGGALYGMASNSTFAAFLRPGNRAARPRGLYLASGSAHPGGGVPLCLLSGRQAAADVMEDA